jgi:hypothetical protein
MNRTAKILGKTVVPLMQSLSSLSLSLRGKKVKTQALGETIPTQKNWVVSKSIKYSKD